MKNLLWSKVIGVAMIAGLILPVAVSANGIGGRPANPDPNNPRTSSIFIYNLSGGASKSDQLYIQNGSDKEETIEVYSVDGTVTTTGDMTCKEKSEGKVGAGKWVSVSKKKRKSSQQFYKLLNLLSDIEIKEGSADFRLLDQSVVEVIRHMRENEPFLRGMVPWVGFKQVYVPYTAQARYSGETKYTLKKMFQLALSGVTSFSVKPLYFAVFLGFFFSMLSVLYIPYVIYSFLNGSEISGWASLIMTIVFFGGLQLIILGIIGVYIGKIFTQTKERPAYIIQEKHL